MTVIARDAVATDHLVYCWPFPVGPECEVACSEDEQVVMCPAWMVGDRLGPGRHRWRTPDPTRPVGVFFVLTAPVDVNFDMVTSFVIPTTGQPVRLRSSGSLQVRCADPGLLIAQFVGLPFDHINDGVLRSVRRSVERMLARLLTRRVVMAGSPAAVTEPGMLQGIVEELIAYNPTAGAVFGVELIRMGYVVVAADDGSTPFIDLPAAPVEAKLPRASSNGANGHAYEAPTEPAPSASGAKFPRPKTPLLETVRGMPVVDASDEAPTPPVSSTAPTKPRPASIPPPEKPAALATVSGEIGAKKLPPVPAPPTSASGEILQKQRPERSTIASAAVPPPAAPPPRRAAPIEVPRSDDEVTTPATVPTKPEPAVAAVTPKATTTATPVKGTPVAAKPEPPRGAILGIGMGGIGTSEVSGEIPTKIPVGGRVLVPGPNGLMQSATVRQMLQGYYELEIGSTGQTVWVPIGGVVAD